MERETELGTSQKLLTLADHIRNLGHTSNSALSSYADASQLFFLTLPYSSSRCVEKHGKFVHVVSETGEAETLHIKVWFSTSSFPRYTRPDLQQKSISVVTRVR